MERRKKTEYDRNSSALKGKNRATLAIDLDALPIRSPGRTKNSQSLWSAAVAHIEHHTQHAPVCANMLVPMTPHLLLISMQSGGEGADDKCQRLNSLSSDS